MLKIA
jgi:clusterin-associated protein 1